MTKPTTIDGRHVLWHSVVRDKSILADDPDEVAVTSAPMECGGKMIWGCYRGRWIANTGNRAAVRMLLDEVERLQAQLAKARDFAKAHERWEAAVILCDDAWDTSDGMPKLDRALYDQALDVQRLRNVFIECDQ